MRLATPADEAFLAEMLELAGFSATAAWVHDDGYQGAIRAAVRTRGAYWRTLNRRYNESVTAGETAFANAASVGSFDLITQRGRQPVAAQSVGTSVAVVHGMLDHGLDSRQVIALMMGLPKARGLGVAPLCQGRGIGTATLAALHQILDVIGCPAMYAECRDDLAEYYTQRGWRVLPAGSAMNCWPLAGDHIVTHKLGDPSLGPFINAMPGFRIMYLLANHRDETTVELARLNQPG